MKTFIQNGHVITITAPAGGVSSGDGILVGSLFGVAAYAALEGKPVEIAIGGVFEMPKDPTAVLAIGEAVAWDVAAKHVTVPGLGLYPIGVATAAAGNGATTAAVRLDGVATAPA